MAVDKVRNQIIPQLVVEAMAAKTLALAVAVLALQIQTVAVAVAALAPTEIPMVLFFLVMIL